MKTTVTFQIESRHGAQDEDRSWSTIGWREYTREDQAREALRDLRDSNLTRDHLTRTQKRPCTIWTPDGTWASYRSAGTNYRLIKITREVEVIDEDPNYNPSL
jgi:hypothetical protein